MSVTVCDFRINVCHGLWGGGGGRGGWVQISTLKLQHFFLVRVSQKDRTKLQPLIFHCLEKVIDRFILIFLHHVLKTQYLGNESFSDLSYPIEIYL